MNEPTTTYASPDPLALMTSIIFGLTYLFLAMGKIPRLRVDRAGIALVGAATLLALRVLGLDEAARAVDVPTIVLLFGMMIVVAYVRISGFFAVVTHWIATRRLGPHGLLAVTIGLAGVLSAALVAGMHAASGGADAALQSARAVLSDVPAIDVDYLEVRDPALGPAPPHGPARLLVAARLGATRLLDNVAIEIRTAVGVNGREPALPTGRFESLWRN